MLHGCRSSRCKNRRQPLARCAPEPLSSSQIGWPSSRAHASSRKDLLLVDRDIQRRAAAVAILSMILLGTSVVPRAFAGDGLAPVFTVRALDGKSVRLSDFRGRPVV